MGHGPHGNEVFLTDPSTFILYRKKKHTNMTSKIRIYRAECLFILYFKVEVHSNRNIATLSNEKTETLHHQ